MARPNEDNTGLTGAFDLFTKSKDLVIKNINIFIILYLLPFVYAVITTFDRKTIGETTKSGRFGNLSRAGAMGLIGFGAAVAAVTLVINIIVQIMTVIATFEVSNKKKPTLRGLWESSKKFGPRLIGLAVVVGLLLIGGFILLIVPGLIVLQRYFLSPYFLIDKDLSIGEAMKQSAAQCKPYFSSIWGVIGVTILLSFTGVLPVIGSILSFVLVSLYSVAAPLRYREIKRLNTGTKTA